MLSNLRLVLLQQRKFLATFFLVVFLPSVVLAYFGIRAIHNERYKLQQLNLERQRGFVRDLKAEIQSVVDRETLGLRELSTNRALIGRDYPSLHDLVLRRLQERSVLGEIVVWNRDAALLFLGRSARPPQARPRDAPAEWKRLQPDLARAENSEFRIKNFAEAISLYRRILQRVKDETVKAWITGRIARCEVKQNNFQLAAQTYLSIIERFPAAVTESGRPLEIVSRMERLDALRADRKFGTFFPELVQTLKHLEQNFWSLGGDRIGQYAAMILQMVDEVVRDSASERPPDNFESSVKDIQNSLAQKLEIWRLAEAVRKELLPGLRSKMANSASERPSIEKDVLEYEGKDVLVILLPLAGRTPDTADEFLGSLLRIGDLKETLDIRLKESRPAGLSLLIRSSRSERVLFGDEKSAGQMPAFTDFFPENFPPWKVEVFQSESSREGIPLYKNIFFWTILALLFIVFFGSGLIIRTIVKEVSLLNLKSEFIASVSHEFKTPLTAMGAILERLLSDEVRDPKKTREYYRILSDDSDRLTRLVMNVLDFTKIEDGKREYKLTPVDIARLVLQEVDSFQKENEPAGFIVATKSDADIPPVPADDEALRQALHNILDNAAKFSGREKNIDVAVKRRQGSVEIAVEDRGVGIPESEQKKVFEKFYRGRQASSVSPTGTGLGLTLVKHIMDAHGGRVALASRPGKGTRVSLILPLGKGG